jgi:hypothetical protein
MQNFSSQDGIRQIFDIFQGKFRFFQEYSKANFRNFQNHVCRSMCQPTKHIHAKFQLFSFYPDGRRQIFDLLFFFKLENFKILKGIFLVFFLRKFKKMFLIFFTSDVSQEISKF